MNASAPIRSNSFFSASLAAADPEIARAVELELGRQRDEIELIASENIVSRAVLEAQGSVMTNKYAEGYPGKRYYGGCQFVDIAETLAIQRACQLFDCKFANVQPNSGSQANQAVFLALLKPGDTFMGLDLAAGGHLTHGSPVNLSGKWFHCVSYGVDRETQRIDMDEVAKLAREHKPKLIVAGGSAYARHWDFARFREIADEVGAYFLCDIAHFAGLVAGGAHPSPFPHAHVVTTTTHKDVARPARRHGADQRRGHRQEDQFRCVSRPSGRPADACDRRQGGGVPRGADAGIPKLRQGLWFANAKAMAERILAGGYKLVTAGTDNQSDARGPDPEEAHRQGGRGGFGAGAHHLQQERHPVRPGKAFRHLGRPARHAGGDVARVRGRPNSPRLAI